MQSLSASINDVVNYYTVLGLPQPRSGSFNTISKDVVKSAYHRALLLHHPDKTVKYNTNSQSTTNTRPRDRQYSIDEIVRAYQTLADPSLKTVYDDGLLKNNPLNKPSERGTIQKGTHLGVEVYDLEDMTYDEKKGQWYKSCRCGDEEGYTVTETELEKESHAGEIYVGCQGCSLFVEILFGLVEDHNALFDGE